MKIIEAAGGLVTNNEGCVLMIFRRGYWDLPKGKTEQGESIEQCALREVQEECGVGNLVLGRFLCITEHQYMLDEMPVLKKTTWFHMTGSGKLTPQTLEDIQIARWILPDELPERLALSYPTIGEVFECYLKK